ncbi:sodium-dependent dicarboxylate transporter 2/3/5 [Sphingopyxis italica]|uniref:Sodium-dependent dicarboxylate transporter 2/3/5 n=1 Tax=Sphingopyxis italica TaxID=1129133 RepID=A0A7X5XT05_9SPHN|nr:DASS family sodium-coupled anion symporter [Sphingopyxis italica]NJB90389.1 sodium-dependent dicarboxylate transporter 2/3/5 [Sphingopyxis italica]
MTRTRWFGLVGGLLVFVFMLLAPAPAGMELTAWRVAALTVLMAIWWMTEALPLTVTALLPFLTVPAFGVMNANAIAKEYYSPILFLILGGAFLALAIERVGLHRRLALALLKRASPTASGLLFAFMVATALLSMFISNTSTTLIMIPIALAVVRAGGVRDGETDGFAGAVMMGIAFAASLGGLGTLVGSPTNAIAAGLIEKALGLNISFLDWAIYGVPIVLLSVPIAMAILGRVQRLADHPFDGTAAAAALGNQAIWSTAERRVVPIFLLVLTAWIVQPWFEPMLPKGALTDGTIAVAGSLLLFILPDGTGRPLLLWKEADRAPWGVIMMFGGGLALAAAITASGLAAWLGAVLAPLGSVPTILLAATIVALTILITEFASNVATASGIMPVLAALIAATGVDPILLALPVAMAASWGFMLPSGTGPNALAWATGHIALPRILKAGLALDIIGVPLLIGVIWAIAMIG